MKYFLPFILLITFCSGSFAKSLLLPSYNSMDFNVKPSYGDIDGVTSTIGLSFKPENVKFLLSYEYAHTSVDDVKNIKLEEVDLEADTFFLGYLIDIVDNLHIIPYLSVSANDYSYHGYDEVKTDSSSFGILFRTLLRDNSVLNFQLSYTSVDDISITSTDRTEINNRIVAFGDAALTETQFDILEDQTNSSTTVLSVELEYHYADNIALSYGLSTNFDSTSLSFGLGFDY